MGGNTKQANGSTGNLTSTIFNGEPSASFNATNTGMQRALSDNNNTTSSSINISNSVPAEEGPKESDSTQVGHDEENEPCGPNGLVQTSETGQPEAPIQANISNPTNNAASSGNSGNPPPARRSSFGLGFLATLTNSIRSQHNAMPAENSQNFMSSSPTIANLNNYSMSTPANNIGNELAINEDISGFDSKPGSESSHSDFEQPVNANNGSNITEEIIDGDRTRVPLTNTLEDPLAEEDSKLPDNGIDKDGFFSVRLTPLIDYSSSASGLYFSPVIRKIKPDSNISIGRYTEKNKTAAHAPQGSSAPIVFKSKVVSRTHALFQCNEDGQWFLKDCKSSSGTFLNHIRLSPASQALTMMPLIDGDIVQLGMDYRGGTEEVYRCVKMRCEFNKSWQRKVNQFNLEIHQKLKNLAIGSGDDVALNPLNKALESQKFSECAICLLELEPCQALFISPCSHSWHYKCIRPIIIKSYPQFYCPNCRSMCDLETDIEDDDA